MWIIIVGIICEIILGGYVTYWLWKTYENKWPGIATILLTVALALGTWRDIL